jgi:hypothetical protein
MIRFALVLAVVLLMAPEKVDWSFTKKTPSLAKNLFEPFVETKNTQPKVEVQKEPEVYFYQQLPVIRYYDEPRRVIYGTRSICIP